MMQSGSIYHLYPLGFTGANQNYNDGVTVQSLQSIIPLLEHLKTMHMSTLLLGPVFESETHGYDTVDYTKVDRRLGNKEDLIALVKACHDSGIKVMLDCVFNHVARSHAAFEDIQRNKEQSKYKGWVLGLNFGENNRSNDGFSYECWDGHEQLVKLNLDNPEVQDSLIRTAVDWVDIYDIDGLRMDAADVMSKRFLKELTVTLKKKKETFMMIGEVVHGDYNQWLHEGGLDAVTNYEAYKGLYSSLNDENYFEIAYALNKQFGNGGTYVPDTMVNFVDNHDVNRVRSKLKNEAYLYPLYIMLFTMPGIPTLYYGSEFGQKGEKVNGSDAPLRPSWPSVEKDRGAVFETIRRLGAIHHSSVAIREGGYQQVHIDHKVIGYKRQWSGQDVYIFINAKDAAVHVPTPMVHGDFYDLLNNEAYTADGGVDINSCWGRILIRK